MEIHEKRLSISEMYTSDEVFVTGTMGEITPVLEIDGREITNVKGAITDRIMSLYQMMSSSQGIPIPA